MKKYVQFENSGQTKIVGEYGCIQEGDDHPNQGIVDEDDSRYLAFLDYVELVKSPKVISEPIDKLKAFLAANPDVAAIL